MIIPLGHDRDAVKRWPIVTFAVIALCAIAWVATSLAPRTDPEELSARFQAAVEYYVEHPSLQVDPLLRQWLDAALEQLDPESRAVVEKRLARSADPASPLDQTRQEHLDHLTAEWLELLHAGPLTRLGLVPASATAPGFVTHLFVHAGFLHLAFNMLFLYLTAPFIEDVWGRPLFAIFYLLAGVIPAGLFVLRYPDLAIPLVGASGAVAGVMGAFLVRLPTVRIRFALILGLMRLLTFSAPAWIALLVWVAGELVSAHLMDRLAPGSGGAGVAYWVHVWGFGFGAMVALGVRGLKLEERYLEPAIAARSGDAGHPMLRRVDVALQRGRTDEAWRLLREQVARDPGDRDAALAYWDLAVRLDRRRAASGVLLRLVRADLLAGDPESALRHWTDLWAGVPDAAPPIDLEARIAEHLRAIGDKTGAAECVRRALSHVDQHTPGTVLLDLARVAAGLGGTLEEEAVARAVGHPRVPPDARRTLESLHHSGAEAS